MNATLYSKPPGATHWSVRTLARAQRVSPATIHRVWKAHRLQPHRVKSFKLSTDPQFFHKLHDIVGLYLNPPTQALVLSVDEKSQIQALDRTQPILPMRPGIPQRQTHDYTRHGTTTLFAALNVLSGEVLGGCMPRHRHQEFLRFLERIERSAPRRLAIHLILDNYATPTHPAVEAWFVVHPLYHRHFTPNGTSRLKFGGNASSPRSLTSASTGEPFAAWANWSEPSSITSAAALAVPDPWSGLLQRAQLLAKLGIVTKC